MERQHGHANSDNLPTWLEFLVTPRSSIEQVEDRRRARLFLVILLAGVVMCLVVAVTGFILNRSLMGFLVGAAGFAIGYFIGRFISFTLCKFYSLILVTNSTHFVLLFVPSWYDISIAFFSAMVATLMSLLVLRIRTTLFIAIINLLGLIFLPFTDHQITDLALYLTLMAAFSITSLLLLVIGYLNESDVERANTLGKAQQENVDHYRRLLDALPDLMAVHANGKFLYVNAAGMRLLGANHIDEIIGQDVRHFMPESNRSVLATQPHHLNIDNALTVSYQQAFQRIDRRLIDTDVTVSPIQFESELATLLVAHDRRPNETPSQSALPMDRLLDRLPIPIFVTHGTTLLYANHYIEALTGYTPAELKRLSWTQVVSDVQTRTHEDSVAGRIQESEVRVKHKSGESRTLILRTQNQEYRGQRLAISIGYDPRQHTRWSDQDVWMLETAFANYPEGLLYLDMDVRNGPFILSANRVFGHTSGYSKEELRGRTLHFLLGTQGEAKAAELVRQALAEGEVFKGPVVYQRKDTTSAAVSWTVQPIRDDRGQILFAVLGQRPQEEAALSPKQPLHEGERLMLELMSGYAFILEMSPDNNLRLIWTNAAVQDLRRWTEEQYSSVHSWEDLVAPSDIAFLKNFAYESFQDSPPLSIELRLRTYVPGEMRWVRLSIHSIPMFETPDVLRLYCVAHDISERMQAEEEIKVHLVQQSVVMELGLLAIAAEDFKSLVEQVVLLCEQVVPEGICVAALYHPEAKQLVVVGRGTSATVPPVIPFDMRTVMGYTAETSLPILVEDYVTDVRFKEPDWLPPGRVRSALSVSVPGYLHVYGVLALYHTSPRRFTEDDIYFVQSIANVLAAFGERERMQTTEVEQREFMRVVADVTTLINTSIELPDVLRVTQEFIAQVVMKPHSSTIALVGNDELVRVVSQRGFDHVEKQMITQSYALENLPLARAMAQSGEPLLVNDISSSSEWSRIYAPDFKSYLGAPILVEDKCIGFINLASNMADAFTSLDAERLMILAGKIGSAIRNARYAQELEMKIAERTFELARQRGQLQVILDSSGEGVFYTEGTQIVFANNTLATMTGYTVEEIYSGNSTLFYSKDLTDKEKQLLNNIPREILADKVWRHPMRLKRKDGVLFHAGLTISRVDVESDNVLRTVTIVRDISPERLLEEQKIRFISNAAHELRSPISNLNTRLYLLRRAPQNMEEHIRVIERVIERINRLVNDLLDMSYFEHGHVLMRKQPLVLQETLLKAMEFVQGEADQIEVTLRCDLPPLPLTLLADPHRLEQVFINIVIFSLLYTDKNDTITLSAITEHTSDHALVVIEDNGRGIAPDRMEHVFEPFYRRDGRQPGSGLGLALAREIVLLHNGTLNVTSTLETGTRFIIRLPLDGMGTEA